MSPAALLLTCITVLNISIGLYVYRRNPTEPSHRAFAFMATMIGVWTIGLIGAHYSPFGKTLAMRIAFAAASLIPIGVLVICRKHSAALLPQLDTRSRSSSPWP